MAAEDRINVSIDLDLYNRILRRKHKMEDRTKRIVKLSDALRSLMDSRKKNKKGKGKK